MTATTTVGAVPAAAPRDRRARWRGPLAIAAYAVALIVIWQLYVTIAQVPEYLLPAPLAVWDEFLRIAANGMLWPNLLFTVRNIIIGFVAGVVIGIGLGWLLYSSKWFRRIVDPYIVVLQAAPKIALAPLLVLWFGLGLPSQLTLIVLLAFFPMMMSMLLGQSLLSQDVRTLGKLLNLDRWKTFRMIELPGAMPSLLAGAKLAIVDSMTGAFLAEYISAQAGLGYLMVLGNSTYNIPLLFAAVLLTVIVGLLGFALISLLESRLLRWRG